jgi:GTP-binding protein EngB required for normal cell division
MEPKYLNIAFIGSVSVGKSTLLNALLGDTHSDMKMIRTTMCPQIYTESDRVSIADQSIREANRRVNEEIFRSGTSSTKSLPELEYQIPRIKDFYQLDPRLRYRIYDLPGVNDQTDSEAFYRYLEMKMPTFELVFFLLDINHGFRTDEERILVFLIERIRELLIATGKSPHLLVLANKCDSMNIRSNRLDQDFSQLLSSELLDKYHEIEMRVAEVIRKQGLFSLKLFVKMVPFSSRQLYIYRCYQAGRLDRIDDKYLDLIGTSEMGKKHWVRFLASPSGDTRSRKIGTIRDIMEQSDPMDSITNSGMGLILEWFGQRITPKYQQLIIND